MSPVKTNHTWPVKSKSKLKPFPRPFSQTIAPESMETESPRKTRAAFAKHIARAYSMAAQAQAHRRRVRRPGDIFK